jgi:hypothetical protein
MATQPEIAPPDTITPMSPPESPPMTTPSESPGFAEPDVGPVSPDYDQPDRGMPEIMPPPD